MATNPLNSISRYAKLRTPPFPGKRLDGLFMNSRQLGRSWGKETLTLPGQPHDLTLPMNLPIEGNRCTATASLDIPYTPRG